MGSEFILGVGLSLLAQLVASTSQLLLKISAGKTYKVWWRSYLNILVIAAYGMFFGTTIINVFALKYIPLTLSAALGAAGQIFVAIFSVVFLKEKIGKKKLLGLALIVLGIIIFSF